MKSNLFLWNFQIAQPYCNAELAPWQIRKTSIGILPRDGSRAKLLFFPLKIPLGLKSLCRKAADQFRDKRNRSDLYLQIHEVDNRKCLLNGDRYELYHKVEFGANRSALGRFELLLRKLASNAAFWHETHSVSESCEVLRQFIQTYLSIRPTAHFHYHCTGST